MGYDAEFYNSYEWDQDLGFDHKMKYFGWHPDRELNPQFKDLPDVEKMGISVGHKNNKGEYCMSGINFRIPGMEKVFPNESTWLVEQWEPLTLSPSLQCKAPDCSDHGFIREGKWVKA